MPSVPAPAPLANVPPAVRAAMNRDLSDVDLDGLERLSRWLHLQKDAHGPEVDEFSSRVLTLIEKLEDPNSD